MSSRRVRWLLAALALAAAVAWLTRPAPDSGVELAEDEVLVRGRWHLAPRPEALASAAQHRRAQVLSSPYLAGRRRAEGAGGVTVHVAGRAQPGLSFYVSGHAAEARLSDLDGHTLAGWRLPLERAFPDDPVVVHFDYWRRARVLDDGGLVALYQGLGLVRIDRSSRIVWKLFAPLFNDFHVNPDGSIWALAKRPTVAAEIHPHNEVLEDFAVLISPDGRPEREISLLRALADSPWAELLHPVAEAGDVFHSNTITPLHDGLAAPFDVAGLLVSLREIDLVAVLDLDSELVRWARRGPWARQHEPVPLPSGRLLVFDNRGGVGASARVIEVDPADGQVAWRVEGLVSPEAGSVQRLDNGNTLITESERGRALEVAPDGEIVWEMWSPHRTGRDSELVATLFEVVRLPPTCCPFLEDEPPLS